MLSNDPRQSRSKKAVPAAVKSAEVLVLNDDEDHRFLLKRRLDRAGHFVYQAASIEEATRILDERKIDHAVVDFNLRMGSSVPFIEGVLKPRNIPYSIVTAAAEWIRSEDSTWSMTEHRGRVFDMETGFEALLKRIESAR